jgi:fucose 4-O-acetylase-like acetyltransferase
MIKNRQILPDWLKGIGIVLMVYGHIIYVGSWAIFQSHNIKPIIYSFHMPLFLVVSGFFFNLEKDPSQSSKDIIYKLATPYLIFGSLYISAVTIIQKAGVPTTTVPPASFLNFLEIIFFHPRGPYWFIHSLIVIRICFVLSQAINLRLKVDNYIFLLISTVLLAIGCYLNLLLPSTAFYFSLGIILNRFYGKLPTLKIIGILLVIAILLLARSEIFSFSIVQVVWCLSVISFLAGVGKSLEKTLLVSIFAWLGQNSLIILIVHPIFTMLLKPISNILLTIDETGLTYSVIVLISAILGSIASAYLFDKSKISSYLFGVENISSRFRYPT